MLTIIYLQDSISVVEAMGQLNIAGSQIIPPPIGKSDYYRLLSFKDRVLGRDFSEETKETYIFVHDWQCLLYASFFKRIKKLVCPVKTIVYEDEQYLENELDDTGEFLAPYVCKMWDFQFSCLFNDEFFLVEHGVT